MEEEGKGREGEALLLCSKFTGEGEGACAYGGQLGAGFDAVQWMLPSRAYKASCNMLVLQERA